MARSKPTTRKAKPRKRAVKKVVPPRRPEVPQAMLSIDEFCSSHGMSRPFFYTLLAAGLGPATIKLKKRRWISLEAAAEWRRMRAEATTATEAAA